MVFNRSRTIETKVSRCACDQKLQIAHSLYIKSRLRLFARFEKDGLSLILIES